jgi:glutamate dehydrogenase (NAD(P)+)
MGARVVAISDAKGAVHNPHGLDVPALLAYTQQSGSVDGYPEGDRIDHSEMLCLPVDILVPAAMENQITAPVANNLRCQLLVEAANGPTTPAADLILAARGIPVIPDVLANGGGVLVSYFEWVQDLQAFFWSPTEVHDRLLQIMTSSYQAVKHDAAKHRCSFREAAYRIGVGRVAEASRVRGIYP